MSTSKSHMYTANVWCCNMLNIIDVYFKHMSANVWCIQQIVWLVICVNNNRCLLQSHTCIQQMCDVVICWI